MSLPRYSSHLDAGMQPYAPDSKYLRADMGNYPGGVPYLTSEYLQDERVINKNVGRPTNGSIRTSVHTRTRDQNTINVDQLAFMDTKEVDRPKLYNLQALNWWLVNNGDDGGFKIWNDDKELKPYTVKDTNDDILNRDDAQKAYIMNRFKLYGVVVNRDVDNNPNDIPRERIQRDFTCTVKGVCHVLDYWSYDDNLIKPYDSCFFILKKVKITPKMRWQHMITLGSYKGDLKPDTVVQGQLCWQIVPYHCSNTVVPVDELTWEDNGKLRIGSFWRCGNINEYPDVGTQSQYEKRHDPLFVATNITYLHDRGQVTPVHFFLKLGDNFN